MQHKQTQVLSSQNQRLLEEGLLLPVMEIFYSIQGEGFHTGKPAVFARIGGCDVGCHWCDVKESWNAALHPLLPLDEIIVQLTSYPARTVVLTGGEPLGYQLAPLCDALRDKGMGVHVETSGTYEASGYFDWLCLSPKRHAPPLPGMLLMADELKVIVQSAEDFPWAEENARMVKKKCFLYMQPEWSRYQQVLPEIVDYVQQNPKWMISLQSHKFMHIP